MSESRSDRVRNELLRTFLEDLDRGAERTVEEYQALFPGHEMEVAAELASLHADEPNLGTERFGDYRLLRELGRGGQGAVYLALDERLGRRVALKVLRGQPFGGGEDRLRFQREARIASRLDDPAICTVHETGEVDGAPFIAMAYVEGETLAEHIASAREAGDGQVTVPVSGTGGLLEIVERVARSLHRAHGLGVIHRDVKPGNVMVTPAGDPVLLDFGLARASDDGQPTLTRTGDVFGTPAYMAPEQLLGESGEVGPAADVYGLGATLYECLTLHRPYEAPTKEALYRAIAVSEPRDPSSVRQGLAADLRLILITALARDPAGRYRSAADLAEDLRRFRVGEPILARPPSVAYRVRRFVGRHRALVGGTLVLVVGLGAATAVTTMALFRAQDASERESDERVTAERTLEVFENILSSGSARSGGRELLFIDVLDRSVPQLDEEVESLPRAGARLLTAFGRVYTGLGELEKSAALLDRAWTLHCDRDESDTPAALKTRHALGVLLREQAQYDRAQEHLNAVREAYVREKGEHHPDTLRVALDLAVVWLLTGEHARADLALEALLDRATGSLALDVLAEQSELRGMQGRSDEAVEILEDVVRRTEVALGTDHVDAADAWNNLAVEYHEHGRFREAEELYERALDVQKRKLGAGAPDTLSTVRNLGFLYKATGKYAEAEGLYLSSLEAQEAVLDPEHPDVLSTVNNLGRLYQATGDLEQAEEMLRRAVAGGRRRLGDLNPETLTFRGNLGLVLHDRRKLDEAEEVLVETLADRERALEPNHPETLKSMNNLAWLLIDLGRPDEALEFFERSLAGRRERLGGGNPGTLRALYNLAWFLAKQGRFEDAAPYLEESVELGRVGGEALLPELTRALRDLAGLRLEQGRGSDASELGLELLELLAPDDPMRALVEGMIERADALGDED